MKIIIHNRAKLPDLDAVSGVFKILQRGKISEGRFGRQYCHLSANADMSVSCVLYSADTATFYVNQAPDVGF